MTTNRSQTYNNLIDFCIKMAADPEIEGGTENHFRTILSDYFFSEESRDSKKMEALFNEIELPKSVKSAESIFQLDVERLREEIEDGMINETLCGRIYLSQAYLKAFHKDHPPQYSKLPEDVKFEIMDLIKEKNNAIVDAFSKMKDDIMADKNRKISTLIALILKNIHLKTGQPFNRIATPAGKIINDIFINGDEVFTAGDRQLSDLRDESKIKDLMKHYFPVRQFSDLTELSGHFKNELSRFVTRARRSD